MLRIILMILMVIGIILLIILGLILFLLISILAVPVRYRGQGSYHDSPEGILTCSWFLHILTARFRYDGDLEVQFRLFGFRLFKKKDYETDEELKELAEDGLEEGADAVRRQTEPLRDPKTGYSKDEELILSTQEVPNVPDKEPVVREQTEQRKTKRVRQAEANLSQPQSQTEKLAEKTGLWERLKSKARAFLTKLKKIAASLLAGYRKAADWKQKLVDFLTDEENQKTYRLIKQEAKRILRHLRPRRIEGQVAFGLEDPYMMGQVLSGLAFLYPYYGKTLTVLPDFEEHKLEGDIKLRGRIRIGTLLYSAGRLMLNKNFRTQLNKFMNRGGNVDGR